MRLHAFEVVVSEFKAKKEVDENTYQIVISEERLRIILKIKKGEFNIVNCLENNIEKIDEEYRRVDDRLFLQLANEWRYVLHDLAVLNNKKSYTKFKVKEIYYIGKCSAVCIDNETDNTTLHDYYI
jgi:hypothetical protein